jgi:hypothetical protein
MADCEWDLMSNKRVGSISLGFVTRATIIRRPGLSHRIGIKVRNIYYSWDKIYATIAKGFESGMKSFAIPSDHSCKALDCLERVQQTL